MGDAAAGEALLSTLRAQPSALQTLRRALSSGRVHHAYLFDGPDGVGKERAAFGLAQALVCERRSEGSADACGRCSACLRSVPRAPQAEGVAGLPVHPDVVVIERGLHDPAAIGRRTPETQDISIDQVRALVLARSAFPPHEGRAKVFVVRRAEELSVSAANALLKTLEEPGARTHFVLLSSAGDTLLPTIRSRTLRIRFAPLPDAVVADLLRAHGTPPDVADAVAPLASGSMSAALVLCDAEASAERAQFVSRAMAAVESKDSGAALDLAEEAKKAPKERVLLHLDALGASLAGQGRGAAHSPGRAAEAAASRYALTLAAVQQIEANASVQLAVESMLLRMRAT
jgi:DNA polymerase-3 subunit delta'